MDRTPRINEYGYGHGPAAELRCPGCGSNYLHHETVKVFSRYEDQATMVVTTVTPTTREEPSVTSVETVIGEEGNPSSRRHGVTIRFTCEECPGVFLLNIAQHKGNTQIEWSETK